MESKDDEIKRLVIITDAIDTIRYRIEQQIRNEENMNIRESMDNAYLQYKTDIFAKYKYPHVQLRNLGRVKVSKHAIIEMDEKTENRWKKLYDSLWNEWNGLYNPQKPYQKTQTKKVQRRPSVSLPNEPKLKCLSNNKECAVCLDELVNNQLISKLPCGHCFHDTCIRKWLDTKNLCPLCKSGPFGTKQHFPSSRKAESIYTVKDLRKRRMSAPNLLQKKSPLFGRRSRVSKSRSRRRSRRRSRISKSRFRRRSRISKSRTRVSKSRTRVSKSRSRVSKSRSRRRFRV